MAISHSTSTRFVLSILAWCLSWSCAQENTEELAPGTEELAPGVVYHEIHLPEGPWRIHVVEVDLPHAWAAGIRVRTAKQEEAQKTSSLAIGALAAINGDFLFPGESSRPAGLYIESGDLIRIPQRRSAFAITEAGQPLIAVYKMEWGLLTAEGEHLRVAGFNREPVLGELSVFNDRAQVQGDSLQAATGFLLQGLGNTAIANDTISVRVQQIRREAWPLSLQPGQWMLTAGVEYEATEQIALGDTVQLYCRLSPARTKLMEAISGGPRILRDGEVSIEVEKERLSRSFADKRHPRTAIGYSQDEQVLFLIVVDGRDPGYSVGMSLQELAEFMRTRLAEFSRAKVNAHQGLNLDGGGSTTMVVEEQVVNKPSDPTGERPVANALLVVADAWDEERP